MKKVKFFSVVSLFIAFIVFISEISFTQNNDIKDRFTIGAYGWLYRPFFRNTTNAGWYLDLNFNAHQCYTDRSDHDATNIFGGFLDILNNYKGNVNATIDFQNGAFKLLERAKIIRGAYGQRSTYNAEQPSDWNTKFPCYYYELTPVNLITGENFFNEEWQGEIVSGRKCIVGVHDGDKYIVRKLYENCEQVNYLTDSLNPDRYSVSYFVSDNKEVGWKWYIKPRMRIPVSIANDPNRQNDEVVRLEILNYENNEASIVYSIKVKNFKKPDGLYNGEYLEIYYDPEILPFHKYDISVYGSHLRKGYNGSPNTPEPSKVDYRIKWRGLVDVWLDYVRLDDKWAHFLFEPNYPYNQYLFKDKIEEEVGEFARSDGSVYFHMDECAFNNLPCISKVNEIINDYSFTNNKQTALIFTSSEQCLFDFGLGYLRKKPVGNELINFYLNSPICINALKEILLTGFYFADNTVKYPHNLPLNNSNMPPKVEKKYNKANSPNEYNDLLIQRLEETNSMKYIRNAAALLKMAREQQKEIIYSHYLQAHNWETSLINSGYNLREPTNQEISLQCYLAMIYGAKQILYFSYPNEKQTVDNDVFNNYGLLNNTNNGICIQRLENYYGQQKWNEICNINEKLKNIGNIMYPAGQPEKHLIYDVSRTVNKIYNSNVPYGLPYKYIAGILSIIAPGQGSSDCNYDNAFIDCPNECYWEFGFFENNPQSPIGNDHGKYFIALNKRCTPAGNGYAGDYRTLKIRFVPSELPVYNNWKLVNLITGEESHPFNKNSYTNINAGLFQPSEAKLFKLVPVL
jgi:hypothetical protein